MLFKAVDGLIGSLAGGKVYAGRAKQGTALPYIVHFKIGIDPEPDKDDVSTVDNIRYQVSCFDSTLEDAQTLADSVRSAMDAYEGTKATVVILYIEFLDENYLFEEDVQVHHIAQDYRITIKR